MAKSDKFQPKLTKQNVEELTAYTGQSKTLMPRFRKAYLAS